jgi:hypothetical protein
MPLYTNISPKRLMIAGTQTVPVGGVVHTLPANVWLEPGGVAELTEEQAAALEGRVERVAAPAARRRK